MTLNAEDYTPEEAADFINTILRKPGRATALELKHTRPESWGGVGVFIEHAGGSLSVSAQTYREVVREVAKAAFECWPSDDERADHDAHAAKLRRWAAAAAPWADSSQCAACDGVIGAPLCEQCQKLANEGRL